MKKNIILLVLLSLNLMSFSQVKFGINFNTGLNRESIYNRKELVENISKYDVSYEGGLWFGFDLTKNMSLNLETNYFNKNAKIDTLNVDYHYVEVPVYLEYKIGQFNVLGGITNNFSVSKNVTLKFYTISSKVGIEYSPNDFFTFRLVYNQELMYHNLPIIYQKIGQRNCFNSFMFGVALKLVDL